MDKHICFSRVNWHGHEFSCIVVNRLNVYIIINYNSDLQSYESFEIDTRNGEIVKDNFRLKPVYKKLADDNYKLVDIEII